MNTLIRQRSVAATRTDHPVAPCEPVHMTLPSTMAVAIRVNRSLRLAIVTASESESDLSESVLASITH